MLMLVLKVAVLVLAVVMGLLFWSHHSDARVTELTVTSETSNRWRCRWIRVALQHRRGTMLL